MKRIALAILLTTGCSKQPETATQPVPAPTTRSELLPPAPPGGPPSGRLPAPELDTGVSPGAWTRETTATGTIAVFANGLFEVRCAPQAKQIVFAKRVSSPVTTIRIVTDTGAATYAATMHDGEATAAASVSDAFVTDVLAPAVRRIGITANGSIMVVPSDPAIAAVIHGCRRAAGLVTGR